MTPRRPPSRPPASGGCRRAGAASCVPCPVTATLSAASGGLPQGPRNAPGGCARDPPARGPCPCGKLQGRGWRSASDNPEEQARQVCLRLLTLAPRTRAQLADALRKRGIPDEAADEVSSRFEDVGLIDDAAFARAWVESRHYSRGLAGRALSAELKQRGVAADEIRTAIEDRLGPDAEAGRRAAACRQETRVHQGPAARAADPSAGRTARQQGLSGRPRLPGDP